MKALAFLVALTFAFPLTLQAQVISCEQNDLKLAISISDEKVEWNLFLISDISTKIKGQGIWQKEEDSEDAFSSYDDASAISYKSGRAVFVFDSGRGQVLYFPNCYTDIE